MPYVYAARAKGDKTHSAREALKSVLHCAHCAKAILRVARKLRRR